MRKTATVWISNIVLAVFALCLFAGNADARVDGIPGPSFTLTARSDYISTGDGNSVLVWAYARNATARAQYPGPTLKVTQGQNVTITLTNRLTVPTSIVFPGQDQVIATGGALDGNLAREAAPNGGTVTYSFVAGRPGTYIYHSGSRPELQVEMGLVGALIVYPASMPAGKKLAYDDSNSDYDREYLFLLSQMDPRIHEKLAMGSVADVDASGLLADYRPNYFFINGRTAPDTLFPGGAPWLPTQPYGSLVQMSPGEKLLMRVIGGGRERHPFHHHGNHARVIAKDGRLLKSPGAPNLDLSYEVFVVESIPGETVDAIFTWTGKGLGWDIYGTAAGGRDHACNGAGPDNVDPLTKENCEDHNKPFPVTLPEQQFTVLGGFYSGSPFMGASGALPPGEGGLNPNSGFAFMWHSHNERELTNFDIFPGGLLTMLLVDPPGALSPE